MPKMKTNKAAAKRFRVTGKGRVNRPKAGGNHGMQEKSRKRLRRLRKNDMVDSTHAEARQAPSPLRLRKTAMPRAKRGFKARRRRNRILKQAKGFHSARSRLFAYAKEVVMKSWVYAYAHRKLRKRDFRRLWIARINAAARQNGTTYSRLITG